MKQYLSFNISDMLCSIHYLASNINAEGASQRFLQSEKENCQQVHDGNYNALLYAACKVRHLT